MPAADMPLPEPYASAIKDYLGLASRHPEVLSVELCGGLDNPGLSDIDLLLVVGDYARFQAAPLSALRLLNPEGLSPLFAHGPFVCLGSEYAELIANTTLRPRALWRHERFRPAAPTTNAASDAYGTLIVQSAYVTHLAGALPKAHAARHRLLLAGSVRQSLIALSRSSDTAFAAASSARAARIAFLRSEWARERNPVHAKEAQKEALTACGELKTELARCIREELTRGTLHWGGTTVPPLDDKELVSAFSLACFAHGLGTAEPPHLPPITGGVSLKTAVGTRFNFTIALLDAQLRHNILAAGAEFPFTAPGLPTRIGMGIWLRRILKRLARLRALIHQ